MRRKSERAASKKAKASPEKKVEKVKQTRTRRKKQSTSSENESFEEPVPAPETVIVVQIEEKSPQTPAKELTAEEAQDQIWRVKAPEGSGDAREIQKLKICLTRPPSTPERVDRSPRSKRKHTRATSSSDTPSVEAVEDRRKSKHRSRRLHRESKDGSEKNLDSHGEEQDNDTPQAKDNDSEVTQSETVEEIVIVEAPMSTTTEEPNKTENSNLESSQEASVVEPVSDKQDKTSDADTTVVSPTAETTALPTKETMETPSSESIIVVSISETTSAVSTSETTISGSTSETAISGSPSETAIAGSSTGEPAITVSSSETTIAVSSSEATIAASSSETTIVGPTSETTIAKPTNYTIIVESGSETTTVPISGTIVALSSETVVPSKSESRENTLDKNISSKQDSPVRKRSVSVDKSEILELHAEDSKCESDNEMGKTKEDSEDLSIASHDVASHGAEVSKVTDKSISKGAESAVSESIKAINESSKAINKTDVVESFESERESRKMTMDTGKEQVHSLNKNDEGSEDKRHQSRDLERSDSLQSNQEEPIHNGQSAPIIVSRKRRWGSRPKVASQKSINISTDILKDIIPDVKPVEFDEVIEDRKHKREVTEKIERPVLPKIIIDNTENIERRKEHTEKDKDNKDKDNVKVKESHLAMNRKISIVQENESIISRPPSPPRHKQSCILFITNLVRPFTVQQLKNLLQRTGRIIDNGFWIDKIKSKCFVIYQSEEQAVETRHALHGVTWPVSNPKSLQVDFSTQEAFDMAKLNEDADNAQVSTLPGTVEDWLREQDIKRERGEPLQEKPWERKAATREWDLGKGDKEKDKLRRDDRLPMEKRRHRTPERSPEPARKFKKKEEEAPAKLLDDLFRKTKTTPCIYWLPLSAEMIAIKEEQRRQHMADHERRLQEQRRTHRRH